MRKVATVSRPAISSVSMVIEASARIVNSQGPAAITAAWPAAATTEESVSWRLNARS